MNWITIGISLLISLSTLILASQLVTKISQDSQVRKPISVKPEPVVRKRR